MIQIGFLAIVFTLNAFLQSCAYLIRGGDYLLFKGPLKAARFWGCGLAAFSFASWILYTHDNLYLAAWFPLGWFLTIMMGWSSFFDCSTVWHTFLMFLRMLESVALFIPLAIIKTLPAHVTSWHDLSGHAAIVGLIYSIVFAALTALWYAADTHFKISGSTDQDLDWSELGTGVLLGVAAQTLVTYAL